MKKVPPPFQTPMTAELPKTRREIYAESLRLDEREFRDAQKALEGDDSNESRARYAKALADYDALQGMFPFIAAGLGDEVV